VQRPILLQSFQILPLLFSQSVCFLFLACWAAFTLLRLSSILAPLFYLYSPVFLLLLRASPRPAQFALFFCFRDVDGLPYHFLRDLMLFGDREGSVTRLAVSLQQGTFSARLGIGFGGMEDLTVDRCLGAAFVLLYRDNSCN